MNVHLIVVMCQAGLKALKPRVPGPRSLSLARPYSGLGGLEGLACLPPSPSLALKPRALGIVYII